MKKFLCAMFSVGMFSLVCFGNAAPVNASPAVAPAASDSAEPMTCGRACILAGGACCGAYCC